MNKLSIEKQVKVIQALVEGNSIRSTVRMTGVSKWAVMRLLVSVGRSCREYQDKTLRNLPCKTIQVDEIWSYCYARRENVPKKYKRAYGYGDAWTWVALDPETKLVPSWIVGTRELDYAMAFMLDLKSRLKYRVQLTSDGYSAYLAAVEEAFGSEVDFSMIVKIYAKPKEEQDYFRPLECIGTEVKIVTGNPDRKKISTSHVERQNLTMRTNMKRFTRKTNGFSKKLENLESAVSLHFMFYNFCRPHMALNKKKSLGITPAMAAGVAHKAWTLGDIVGLVG